MRSRDARMEESSQRDVYDRVYDADRPELFLKATANRVSGPGEAIAIRGDSGWDVPEPELLAWIMGQEPTPKAFDQPVFRRMRDFRRGAV